MRLGTIRKADWFVGLLLAVILSPIAKFVKAVFPRDPSFDSVKKIAVIKLLGGGNFAMALPMLLGIRKSFPQCELIAVVTPSTASFAQTIGIFDKIVLIEFRSLPKLFISGIRAITTVFRTDALLDLEIHSKLATCFGFITCARNRLGFFTNDFFLRKNLYTHLVFFNPQALRPELYNQLAIILGGRAATHEDCNHHLRAILSPDKSPINTVAVGVGCSELGVERRLETAQWRDILLRGLQNSGAQRVVFLGSRADGQQAQSVIDELKAQSLQIAFENLCGELPLSESIRILASCSFFWGIDSALLHFARLLAIPSESFWGPTDPTTLLAPIEKYSERIHYKRIICSPCIHVAEESPCGGRNLCIRGLFDDDSIDNQKALANTTFSLKRR